MQHAIIAGLNQIQHLVQANYLLLTLRDTQESHTTAPQRFAWLGNEIDDGLIRASIGVEHTDDLREDLEQAFRSSSTP